MSITIDEVQAKFTADSSSMQAALNQINSSIDRLKNQTIQATSQMEKSLSSVNSHVSRMGGFFQQALASATGFFSAQVGWRVVDTSINAARNALFGFNNTMQSAEIGFKTLTGSGEITAALLRQLQSIAQTTPFEFPDLTVAATRMMAFGFTAKEVGPLIRTIADAASSTGQISSDQFERITRAIGQMRTMGKLNAQDMMQLTNAGIAAWELMSQKLGVSTAKLREMSEQGILPADKAINALVQGMNERFAGASVRASTTFVGAMSNIKDSINIALGTSFRPLFDLMTEGLNKLAKWMQTSSDFRAATILMGQAVQAFTNALREMFKGNNDPMQEIIGFVTRGVAYLTTNAAIWGFNFTASFASGMINAVGSSLNAAIGAIVESIAGFFESFSPPKKGKLSRIDQWGTSLITTYMQGMTKADYSMLDQITSNIRDALKLDVMLGNIGDLDLIPKLFGSQQAVAQAINQLRTVGEVSEDVFGTLNDLLGDSATGVNDLVREFIELAKQDNIVRNLTDEIKEHQREIDKLTEAYEDLREEIDRKIKAAEHAHSVAIRGLEEEARKLQDLIRLRESEKRDLMDAQDIEIARLQLTTDRTELAKLETAHITRAADAQKDVAAATKAVTDAQRALNEEQQKGNKADPRRIRDLQENVSEAQSRLQQAQTKVVEEGKQTDEDRLKIAQARRDITQGELQVETIGHRQRLVAINEEKGAEERKLEDTTRPMREQMADITEEFEAQKFAIQEQMEPLERQLEIEQQNLELHKQRVEQLQAAFDLEKGIADELDRQQKAMLASTGGGAGAGAKLSGSPLKFDFGDQAGLDKFGEDAVNAVNKSLSDKLDKMKEDIRKKFSFSLMDALSKPEIDGAIVGAALGVYFGGPLGLVVGAAAGGLAGHFAKEWTAGITKALIGEDIKVATATSLTEYGEFVGSTTSVHVNGRFEEEFTKVKEIASSIWSGTKEVSDAIISPMVDFWVSQFNIVKVWFDENWPLIQETALNAWNRIQTAGEVFWSIFGGQFTIATAAIKVVWDIFWTAIETVASTTLNTLLGALRIAMQLFNGDWEGAWETVKKTVNENLRIIGENFQLDKFAVWGRNMIVGFKQGLDEKKDELLEHVRKFFSSLKDKAKEGLGEFWPFSPSKAGIKVGLGFMEGVGVGIDQGKDIVVKASKTVAESIAKEVSPSKILKKATEQGNIGGGSSVTSAISQDIMNAELEAANKWMQAAFLGGTFNPGGVTGGGALTPNSGNILVPSASDPFPYTNPIDTSGGTPVSPLDNVGFMMPNFGLAGYLGNAYSGNTIFGGSAAQMRDVINGRYGKVSGIEPGRTYEESLEIQRKQRQNMKLGEYAEMPVMVQANVVVNNFLDGEQIASKYQTISGGKAERLRNKSSE